MNEELDKKVIRTRARMIMLEKAWRAIIVVMLGFILTLLTIDYLSGVEARKELLDCTLEGGKCYAEGQQRTAEAITQILDETEQTMIDIVKCARKTETEKQLDECLSQLKKEQGDQP